MDRPRITCSKDGPYLVEGLARLEGPAGPILTPGKAALCRCGRSQNKPFCDGGHKGARFESAKSPERVPDRRRSYAGKAITVHDNRGLCAHAALCTERLPGVFQSAGRPWIDPDGAAVEEVIAVVRACPSGALSYSLEGRESREREGEPPAIRVAPKGPYVVTGGCVLVGERPNEGAALSHFTLCRCGASRNKPFCDGAHWTTEFD
jgi:CDGSH-type Zn-finger protein